MIDGITSLCSKTFNWNDISIRVSSMTIRLFSGHSYSMWRCITCSNIHHFALCFQRITGWIQTLVLSSNLDRKLSTMQFTVLNPSLDILDNSFVYWKMNTLSILLLQSPTFCSKEFHKKKHGQHNLCRYR